MKKRGLAAVVLALIMVMMCGVFSFAGDNTGDLKLVSSYPEDGQKNTSIENVGVKLFFSNTINNPETEKHNKNCVKIVNSETGKKIPI